MTAAAHSRPPPAPSAEILHRLGVDALRAGDAGRAAERFRSALGLEPGLTAAAEGLWLALAGCLPGWQAGGRTDAMRRALVQIAALRPDQAAAHAWLGDLERLYRRALALDDRQPGLRSALWGALRDQGRTAPYHSSDGQDAFVHQTFFPGRTGGVFVDVGAYDGVEGSNTLFFEREAGWRGVCVEASPVQFARLRANRTCACVHAAIAGGAIADAGGEAEFLEVLEGPTMVGGLVAAYDPAMGERLAALDPPRRVLRVPVRRLSAVLAEAGIAHVDYCSIDTEGAEGLVLDSLDFGRVTVTVFSIENNRDDPALRARMDGLGYGFVVRLGADDLFHRRPTG